MTPASEPKIEPVKKRSLVDIAVLDDDVDFISYIEDFLNDEGLYTVRPFTHPDDLFESCEEKAPHIILLDMKMGPFKGEDVLDELLARHPEICVIIVTGYPSLEGMRATFKKRVFDYLAKPFSLVQLRQTLSNAVDTHRLGRTPQEVLREKLGTASRCCGWNGSGHSKTRPARPASASHNSARSSAARTCRVSRASWRCAKRLPSSRPTCLHQSNSKAEAS